MYPSLPDASESGHDFFRLVGFLLRPDLSTEMKCLILLPVIGSTETRSNCRLADGPVNLSAEKN